MFLAWVRKFQSRKSKLGARPARARAATRLGVEQLEDRQLLSAGVSLVFGNGRGGFSAPAAVSAGLNPVAAAVGDFNAGGKQDLAVVNGGAPAGPSAAPGQFGFQAANFSVPEDAGSATVTVVRGGGSDGAVTEL